MFIKYYIYIYSYQNLFLNKFLNKFKNLFKNNKTVNFFFPLKKKKFTVLKSPHIYKKSREQFEIRNYKLVINLNLLLDKRFKLINFIKYLNINSINYKFLPISLKIKEIIKI